MRIDDTVDTVEENLLAEVVGDLIDRDHFEEILDASCVL
jgi:hypothetical protein